MKTQISQAFTERATRSAVRSARFPPSSFTRHHPTRLSLRNDVRMSSAAVDEIVQETSAVEEVVSQAIKQVSSLDRIGKVSGRLI